MNLDRVIAVRNDKTIYRDGDRCVKVFNAGYSKESILSEALNQARIEETDLKIPKVLEVTTIEGKWAIVSEHIKGKTMAQLMAEHPEKKAELFELFVDLQGMVHTKSCPHLKRLKDDMAAKILQAELSSKQREELLARLDGMPEHTKVCHGDFHPSNVLIDDNDIPFLLDWSYATQGDPCADVAATYLLFLLHDNGFEAEAYLTTFCRKSALPMEEVRKWLPFVAAARSARANERERKLLRRWIDGVNDQSSPKDVNL